MMAKTKRVQMPSGVLMFHKYCHCVTLTISEPSVSAPSRRVGRVWTDVTFVLINILVTLFCRRGRGGAVSLFLVLSSLHLLYLPFFCFKAKLFCKALWYNA